jgi:hypothetical protein
MKNINKLKSIQKIAGFIALIAIIVFSMAACDLFGDDDPKLAMGTYYFGSNSHITFAAAGR